MKHALNIEEQINKLKEHGMVFDNEEKAKEILLDVGYYRLGFYSFPFEKTFPSLRNRNHKLCEGTSFKEIVKNDVYKNFFKGKNVIIEIDSQGARQIRKQQKIQSVFLIPPSFDELLHRLKIRGTETEESIRRRLKQALVEIEHVEEYGVILVNDSVEGTAFVVDALFHPALKHACGCNERELNIVKEIREGIIRYLSNGNLSDRGIY